LALVIFWIESHSFLLGPAQIFMLLCMLLLWTGSATGAYYHTQLICWDGILLTFCLGCLKLWSSWSLPPKLLGLQARARVPAFTWVKRHSSEKRKEPCVVLFRLLQFQTLTAAPGLSF
jgi:hypothetical protein